ncbi:MAG: aminotransferase class I/II-fold pyridoxal phosphate-dependent enzyme [Polyangiaceae bacterium]|nr:aminotransferase class I/II-fold pyridoxal phosphate-dependent enzyme [Polyangiaceae bacterium]
MSFLISSRTTRPSDDPIFALNAEARARAQSGEKVVNATVGSLLDDEGKLATLDGVNEALREVPPQVVAGYAPIAGSPDFLRGVSLDLLGDRPEAKWVASAATPGGTGALRHAIANFLEPGQQLLTSSFFWGPYKTLADEADRGFATFRMFTEDGALDTDAFHKELSRIVTAQGRALVFLNSPCHNPCGYSFDDAEWRRLRAAIEDVAPKGPVSICLDIAYAKFGAQPLDVMLDAMLPVASKALVMFAWSASKAFLEYGLRVGALVAVVPEDDERRRIQNALSYSCRGTWSNINAGGMAGIASILLDANRRARIDRERGGFIELLARRVALFNDLASKAGLKYPRYDGGFFTTVYVDDALGAAERLKGDGIFVVPQAGALRVALCSVAERDIPRLVDGLAAVRDSNPPK